MEDTDAAEELPVVVEQIAPHVTAIRLSRPERLNALSFPMTAALHDALDAVAADDDCKVVVLTGAVIALGIEAGLYYDDERPEMMARTVLGMHQVRLADWVDRGMIESVSDIEAKVRRQFIRAFCKPEIVAARSTSRTG